MSKHAYLLMLLVFVAAFCSAFDLFEGPNDDVAAANLKFRQQEYEDAIKSYDESIKKLGSKPELHYNKGCALYKSGQYEDAMNEFLKVLSGADDNLKGRDYFNMGNALLQQGKLREAIDSYKRSLRASPGDRDAIYNLELARHLLKQAEEEQKKRDKQQENQENQENQDGQQNQDDQNRQDENGEKQQQQDEQKGDRQPQQDEQNNDKQDGSDMQQQQQQQKQATPEEQQLQQMQAVPEERSDTEKKLDQLQEEEKSFQLFRFMEQQGGQAEGGQDW